MIMKPERSNYEIWLIDYFDGTLDADQVDQLMRFLDENPDLKEEFADNLQFNLKATNDTFVNKRFLRKSFSDLSDEQFELLCISASEHDLTDAQMYDLENMIEGKPEKRRTLDFYKKAVLVAPEMKFRNKSRLRKLSGAQKIIRLTVIGLSAAAGIALFVTLFNTQGKKEAIEVPVAAAEIKDIPGKEDITTQQIPQMTQPRRPSFAEASAGEAGRSKSEVVVEVPALTQEVVHEKIVKLDFKKDVSLASEIPWNITAANRIALQSPVILEKPGLNGLIAKFFRERITKSGTTESGSIKGYEIADAGIIGLNKLFGWQMSLKPTRNKKGEVTSLYFSSKILKFNAPVKRSQEEVSGS
jgi:hypothetical protein